MFEIVMWVVTAPLAFMMVFAGAMKLVKSREALLTDPKMGWADGFGEAQIKTIAAAEVLGGIGVVLPWALGIAPVLTPVAALGLAILMVGASVVHARRSEWSGLAIPAILAILAVIVCVGRFTQM